MQVHPINLPKDRIVPKNVSIENDIGDVSKGVFIRRQLCQFCLNVAFVSHIEPKSVDHALKMTTAF